MIPNNNLSILPWYSSVDQQNARKWWVYNQIYPLFVPAGYLLPFQIIRPHSANTTVSDFKLYAKDGTIVGTYTSAIQSAVTVYSFVSDDYDVIVYSGARLFASIDEGQYYCSLTINGVTWYSEIFSTLNNISKYIKLEWWDSSDFIMDAGRIVYRNGFKNVLYLCTDIAKPDYTFEEEAEERDGYVFPFKQISKKVYHFTFLASEYLLDAMRFIRMADYLVITDKSKVYDKIDSFLITPTWEDYGDVASVDTEFSTLTIAKKLPTIPPLGPDFNNDYNDDFNSPTI